MNLYNQLIWHGKVQYRLYQQKKHRNRYYENKLLKGHDALKIHEELRALQKNRHPHLSKTNFQYGPNIKFGFTLNNIIAHLSFPRYIVNYNNTVIYMYKKRIAGFKVKVELHFLEEQLIYFSKRFSGLSKTQKMQLNKHLLGEYGKNGSLEHWNNIYLKDKFQHTLTVENNIDFVIHYHASGLPIFQKLIHEQFALQKKHELRRKQQFNLLHQLL